MSETGASPDVVKIEQYIPLQPPLHLQLQEAQSRENSFSRGLTQLAGEGYILCHLSMIDEVQGPSIMAVTPERLAALESLLELANAHCAQTHIHIKGDSRCRAIIEGEKMLAKMRQILGVP